MQGNECHPYGSCDLHFFCESVLDESVNAAPSIENEHNQVLKAVESSNFVHYDLHDQ